MIEISGSWTNWICISSCHSYGQISLDAFVGAIPEAKLVDKDSHLIPLEIGRGRDGFYRQTISKFHVMVTSANFRSFCSPLISMDGYPWMMVTFVEQVALLLWGGLSGALKGSDNGWISNHTS